MAPAAFLMGIGPIASWRRAELPDLAARLKWAFVVSAVTAALLPLTMGTWSPLVAVGLFLALRIVATTIAAVVHRLRNAPQRSLGARLAANPAAWYGMLLAHLGVAVFIVGVTLVKGYGIEENVPLRRTKRHGGWRGIHVSRRDPGHRAELSGPGRHDRGAPRRQARADTGIPKSASTTLPARR